MEIHTIYPTYEDYLRDESYFIGEAKSISFPETVEDVIICVKEMLENKTPITIQGGKTGIVGGAVPSMGHILNMSKMDSILNYKQIDSGHALVSVAPGITLLEFTKGLRQFKEGRGFFWPPNPTEPTATIGGIVANGARGCNAYLYGETKQYIESIKMVNCDGEVVDVSRGSHTILDKDLFDLLIGGEGIYGIIVEITLRLIIKPTSIWGICFFFPHKDDALSCIDEIVKNEFHYQSAQLAVLEYVDKQSLKIVEENKNFMTKISDLPEIGSNIEAMIYVEIHAMNEEDVEHVAEELLILSMDSGSDPDLEWALSGDYDVEKIRSFRHAIPESINLHIQKLHLKIPAITKLGTDITKDLSPSNLITYYEKGLEENQLTGCIFGHIGTRHLHINIIPSNEEEYEKGKKLISAWVHESLEEEGIINSEHGYGKLRRRMIKDFSTYPFIQEIEQYKKELDPDCLFNPGTVIAPYGVAIQKGEN